MSKTLEYKNYFAKANYDNRNNCYHGEIINSKATILFNASDYNELGKLFCMIIDNFVQPSEIKKEQTEKSESYLERLYNTECISKKLYECLINDTHFLKKFEEMCETFNDSEITEPSIGYALYRTLLGDEYKNILNKPQFVKTINLIQQIQENDANNNYDYIYIECLIDSLKLVFKDLYYDIIYFINDGEFGKRNPVYFTNEGLKIPVKNAKDLYDFIAYKIYKQG